MHPWKHLHLAAFEVEYFLPAFPEVTLISQYEYYCASAEQLLCLNDVLWFVSLLYQVVPWILFRWMIWGGITVRWAVRAKDISQSPTSPLGSLLLWVPTSLYYFSGLSGSFCAFWARQKRKDSEGLPWYVFSTSPAAQQRIVVYSSAGFRHDRDSCKCPLRNFIWF